VKKMVAGSRHFESQMADPPYRISCVPPALYRCIVISEGG
jgi:hypothetical protein